MTATLGSLFDGSGTCPLAATLCGIEPVWASEIEPFPVAVTTNRFPRMKHLGDITKINGAAIEPVDIITFGSPCQDLSVAGKRAGLGGERSNLFHEAIRIIREMREETANVYPRYVMWENVPGAFSSNKGHDFRAVLEEIAETDVPMPDGGKWAGAGMVELSDRQITWRTLDAQYWGVPQRRRRIFLVADFTGQSAGEILFKPESVSGYTAAGRESREGTAADAQRGATGAIGFDGYNQCLTGDIAQTIRANNADADHIGMVLYPKNTAGSLVARVDGSPCVDRDQPFVAVNRAIPIHDKATRYKGGGDTRNNDGSSNGLGIGKAGDPCPTLDTGDRHAVFDARGNGDGKIVNTLTGDHQNRVTDYTALTLFTNQQFGVYANGDVASTQQARQYKDAMDLCVTQRRFDQYIEANTAATIKAAGGNYAGGSETLNVSNMTVRRLTPTECARLQGFPDWWCSDVPHSDSAEYKMWGNGMALPCVLYVIQNMSKNLL